MFVKAVMSFVPASILCGGGRVGEAYVLYRPPPPPDHYHLRLSRALASLSR